MGAQHVNSHDIHTYNIYRLHRPQSMTMWRRVAHLFARARVSAALPVCGASAGRRLRASVAGARANVAKRSRSCASLSSEAGYRTADRK